MKIKIDQIVLREIRIPLKESFEISSGSEQLRRILLLEVHEAGGLTAWSECVAGSRPNYSPETIDTSWSTLSQWIGPLLLGKELRSHTEVHDILNAEIRGHRMAKAALEMGAWGIAAAAKGMSLSSMLGGTHTSVAVGISIGIQKNTEVLIGRVQEALAQGYRKVKMKIKPGKDVDVVRRVRHAVGGSAPLMVDANNAYTLKDADRLKALDEFDLMMIEQPLAWDDLLRHAMLQKELKTPLCLDESITSVDRVEDMISLGSGKIVNIKSGRVGGLTSALRIHDFCARYDVPVWCGGMLETGIGRAYNVALASLPNFVMPGDISPSARYWERDIVSPPWTMTSDGCIQVPSDRPGIGVDIDVDFINHLTARSETLRPK